MITLIEFGLLLACLAVIRSITSDLKEIVNGLECCDDEQEDETDEDGEDAPDGEDSP